MNRVGVRVSGWSCALAALASAPVVLAASSDAGVGVQLHTALQSAVSAGNIPGGSIVVSSHGKIIAQEAVGVGSAQSKTPLTGDSILWLASMTKPITATAVMMLVEAGKVKIDDPVSKYIPEFSKTSNVRVQQPAVLGGSGGTNYDLVPAAGPITVKELLTHTAGLQVMGIANPSIPPVNAGDTLATWVPHAVDISLEFQPGTRWGYSSAAGFDVLARIVEVASGQGFNQFLSTHIFEPLGMKSMGFRAQRSDLAERMPPIPSAFANDERLIGKTYFSGSAGLYGTLDDYRKFAEMLANGGSFNGKRLLKPASVSAMSSNQVEGMFHTYNNVNYVGGLGFGYGMAIVLDPEASDVHVPAASFGWDGAGGTRFWVSPRQNRVVVYFIPDAGVRNDVETILEKVTN